MSARPNSRLRGSIVAAAFAATLIFSSVAQAGTPQLVTGWDHVCSYSDAGVSSCWGYDDDGEMGTGGTTSGGRPTPGPITVTSGYSQLVTAGDTDCVINANATVSCWGYGLSGVLGNGDTASHLLPQSVIGVTGAVAHWGGSNNGAFCAKRSDQTVFCWGSNSYSQFGIGVTGPDVSTPVQVPGLTGVSKVVFGSRAMCGLVSNGTVRCAGSDGSGQLGLGAGDQSNTAHVEIPGLSGVVDLTAAGNSFCALISGGTLKCWGEDSNGRLGNGPASTGDGDSPGDVPGLTGVAAIGSSGVVYCAATATGSLYCWGNNGEGTVGVGLIGGSYDVPTLVPTAANILAISQGSDSDPLCAFARGGAVSCWGDNNYGAVGFDTGGADVPAPHVVAGVDLITLPYAAGATSLSVPAKPKTDKKKKQYSVTASMFAAPSNLVLPAEACVGTTSANVKYSYVTFKTVKKKRKKTTHKKTVKASGALTLAGAACTSSLKLKLPVKYVNAKKVKITAGFGGNGSLQPFSVTKTYKLPKVKIKKK